MAISYGPEGAFDTRTGLPVDESTFAPEYSLGGDYYRKLADPSKAENLPYWRGAGASHAYQYFKDTDPTDAQNWLQVDPGEHDEQAGYFWAGLNTPQYLEAFNKAAADRTALEKARLEHPDAVGQASVRNEYSLTGGTNEDDWRQELAFLQAYRPDLAGTISEAYTPEMKAAIAQQLAKSTPESQSTREGPSFMDDVFTNIIPGMLAVYGVGSLANMGGLGSLGGAEAGTISAADASAAMGSGVDAAGWGSGALDVLGAAETAGAGAYPWLDAAGNLDVTKFLEMTSPGGEYASAIPGGAEGIAGMDTLGSTSWLESAVNSLKHGDTSWLTSSVSPTQIKSVLSKALGGGSTPTKTGAAKTAAGTAGGAGGINIFNTGGDDSGLADAMKIFSGGRSGMDSVVQAMSQSGKGN